MHLLLIWGADPLIPDGRGNRPIDLAETQNQQQMIALLREAPFSVTDRISLFLCGRKGNHENGQHVVLPDAPPDFSSPTNMLHTLDDRIFAELVRDVYDEVDRREKNQSMSSAATMSIVPFLPVNPLFSSIRNQARQKLATLIRHEFNNLLLDILTDFNRRLCSRNSDMTL
jgi:G protein-coupled receptor kinase interacting protein 2